MHVKVQVKQINRSNCFVICKEENVIYPIYSSNIDALVSHVLLLLSQFNSTIPLGNYQLIRFYKKRIKLLHCMSQYILLNTIKSQFFSNKTLTMEKINN